jgi:hypothetical protein
MFHAMQIMQANIGPTSLSRKAVGEMGNKKLLVEAWKSLDIDILIRGL